MKRIIILITGIMTLLSLCSCEKEGPDYSGTATLYREGDNSYHKEIEEPAFHLAGLTKQKYSFNSLFDRFSREGAFILNLVFPLTPSPQIGSEMIPETVSFLSPYQYSDPKSIESGVIRYMGEEDGLTLLQFEDLTFKVTKKDGSGITDVYYLRGTAKCADPLKN